MIRIIKNLTNQFPKWMFSTIKNNILQEIQKLNLTMEQINQSLKNNIVKSQVTNQNCFQFFKEMLVKPNNEVFPLSDQILLNVALQVHLKRMPELYIISLDLLTQSLRNDLLQTKRFVLDELIPTFDKINSSKSLSISQIRLIDTILEIDQEQCIELIPKVPWQQFTLPDNIEELISLGNSILKFIILIRELKKEKNLIVPGSLQTFENDPFISFWIKQKPSITKIEGDDSILQFFYDEFAKIKAEVSWKQKTAQVQETSNLFEEYFYLTNLLNIDTNLSFVNFKTISISLAEQMAIQKRQVFINEEFLRGIENYFKNVKKNQLDNEFQKFYSIMQNSSVIDEELVGILENQSLTINKKPNIFELLKFYSNSINQLNWHMRQYINYWCKIFWRLKTTTINQKLIIIGYLFQIEGLLKAPNIKDNLTIIDFEMISMINELILSLQTHTLTNDEKVKAFFIINTYYAQEMMKPSFQETFRMYFTDFLKEQNKIISKFQKEIGDELSKMGYSFESEILIFNSFSVDFLLQKKKVIEANGPNHYQIIIGKPKDSLLKLSDNMYIVENKKTSLKTKRLQKFGLEVVNIPYFFWNNAGNKKQELLKDLISGLSFKDIQILLK